MRPGKFQCEYPAAGAVIMFLPYVDFPYRKRLHSFIRGMREGENTQRFPLPWREDRSTGNAARPPLPL